MYQSAGLRDCMVFPVKIIFVRHHILQSAIFQQKIQNKFTSTSVGVKVFEVSNSYYIVILNSREQKLAKQKLKPYRDS